MDVPVFCYQKHNAARCARWAILVLPLLFAGCFDAQSDSKGKAQQSGIAAISRYFSFNQGFSSEKAKEASAATDPLPPGNISESPDLDQKAAELGIAAPAFIESERALSANGPKIGNSSIADLAKFMRRKNSSSESSAANLNASFNNLFASVFGPAKTDEAALFSKDEPFNPFTEARQKQESSTSQSSDSKTDSASNKTQTKKPTASSGDSKVDSSDSQAPITGTGVPAGNRFLIIGDFDGSGILKTTFADRLSATRFAADDGTRDFNLYVNSAPVEQQRSFCIDDINADGYSDLLVTSRASLFGGVFLGNSNGEYALADSFLTGYEPIVPVAGPFFSTNLREILTVNMRSGYLTRFHMVQHYRPFQVEQLSMLPNYLLRMVAPDSSLDYLMTAQSGGSDQILKWSNGALEPTASGLGTDPTVLSGDYGSYSVKAYQVGSYASIVLTTGGSSYNVATMHLDPRIFLIIGDLQQQGFRDIAVANLILFTPKSSH